MLVGELTPLLVDSTLLLSGLPSVNLRCDLFNTLTPLQMLIYSTIKLYQYFAADFAKGNLTGDIGNSDPPPIPYLLSLLMYVLSSLAGAIVGLFNVGGFFGIYLLQLNLHLRWFKKLTHFDIAGVLLVTYFSDRWGRKGKATFDGCFPSLFATDVWPLRSRIHLLRVFLRAGCCTRCWLGKSGHVGVRDFHLLLGCFRPLTHCTLSYRSLGRFFTGIGAWSSLLSAIIYAGECAPTTRRGLLSGIVGPSGMVLMSHHLSVPFTDFCPIIVTLGTFCLSP